MGFYMREEMLETMENESWNWHKIKCNREMPFLYLGYGYLTFVGFI